MEKMNLNDFTEMIRKQYQDANEITLTPDTDIRSIESFDSLTGWMMMGEILDKFGVEITPEDWAKLHTPEEIYKFVVKE